VPLGGPARSVTKLQGIFGNPTTRVRVYSDTAARHTAEHPGLAGSDSRRYAIFPDTPAVALWLHDGFTLNLPGFTPRRASSQH
jgi:hypothetical protein